jgi:hypothetical protein
MDLVTVIIALILVGAVVYISDLLPIEGTFKILIKVVALVALAIWLLRGFAPSFNLG